MSIDELLDKPVHISPKATAKEIRELNSSDRRLNRILSKIVSCYERAKKRKDLSSAEQITLELDWTDLMLELLSFGNSRVMRSIRYRLREQEEEEENAVW